MTPLIRLGTLVRGRFHRLVNESLLELEHSRAASVARHRRRRPRRNLSKAERRSDLASHILAGSAGVVPAMRPPPALREADEAAAADIRDYLSGMPPYEFQNLVAALLKAMGYYVLWVAPPGLDRGIDLIAHNDPLGTSSPRIKVQVKRQAETKIGRDGISSFVGTLDSHDVGIFVSAGGFTTDAEREARSQEQRQFTLIDLGRLVELWIEHSPKLDDAHRQLLPLKPIHFLSPPE
jgi:restriction endonuclease Mrr